MFRNQLREVRQAQDKAQMALAIAAGVSPTIIVAIERHGYLPTPPVRERLAAALGVSVEALWPSQPVAA